MSGILCQKVWAAKRASYSLEEFTYGQNDTMRVGFVKKRIIVQMKPRVGEGAYGFARRVMKDWKNNFHQIKKYNRNPTMRSGRYVTFPLKVLKDSIRGTALKALFPNDTSDKEGWSHRVVYDGETLSFIAAIFTKTAINAEKLAEFNQLKKRGKKLFRGDTILIPWEWIKEELELQPVAVKPPLMVKKDSSGKRYAYYRLQKGEAIYSSVIIRFTGRMLSDDVNLMAKELLALNQIPDARRITPGTELKIPLEWLSEEYLNTNAPVLVSQPSKKVEIIHKKAFRAELEAKYHIILDAGHGGIDPGAVGGSRSRNDLVFEDELVYDISQRMMKMLKTQGYIVHPTVQDTDQQGPTMHLLTEKDQNEVLLVHPRYRIQNTNVGVNMRVYLINHLYQQLTLKEKIPKEHIIFMSIHGDALHPSLRGAMVYYPDARLRKGRFHLKKQIYRMHQEYQNEIKFYDQENRASAEQSLAFGNSIISSFRDEGLTTHAQTAVRGYRWRKNIRTLPAILRYSKIPTSVLVEVANIKNASDRQAILKNQYRQKIAKALVQSIHKRFQNANAPQVALR
ncbi:N-acetylmuramoyl-L-alanine amidase [Deltaproteobacteria bacterium TL4]